MTTNSYFYLALALVILWAVLKFAFLVVSGLVHIVLLLAVVALVIALVRKTRTRL